MIFLACSTSSKSFCLGVPHSTQNLLLFPACSLNTKNMNQEAMKIPCVNIKKFELKIFSFFQASHEMDQFQTLLPKINQAFTLQKKLQIFNIFAHASSFISFIWLFHFNFFFLVSIRQNFMNKSFFHNFVKRNNTFTFQKTI